MVHFEMEIRFEHYDKEAGWENNKPGWHECSVHVNHIDRYLEVIDWVYANIGKCERHCRWCVMNTSTANFKFRYERDYIWFRLTWE